MSEVHKLLKVYLTIPVTTASSEFNFSALKCIKTYLRNSMTQSRLNHCMLLHVHKDRTDCIDNKESFVMSGIKEIMQIDMPQDTSVFYSHPR